jgi:hypothetical protein
VPNDDSEVKALSVEPDIDENAEDEAEELVDVVDGDEGDKVYLEEKVGQSIAARVSQGRSWQKGGVKLTTAIANLQSRFHDSSTERKSPSAQYIRCSPNEASACYLE